MAPSHLGESAFEGAGFLIAGWIQLALAAVLVVRPARWAFAAAVGTSLALIAAWAVSRTAGLPFGEHSGHAEVVTAVDGIAVGLEAATVLLAVLALVAPRLPVLRSAGVAIFGVLAALVLTTAAIASPAARDHASGAHGDHGEAAGTDGGAAAADHHGEAEPVAAAEHGHDATAAADDRGFSALSNGHQHERGVEPLTSEEMVGLANQLAATTALMTQFPTIADAEAAGWTRAGPFSPGLGVHYRGPGFALNPDGDMDPEDLQAPMLIYDGLGADANLAGFMYLAYGTTGEPEGFIGPNDHWHYHEHVCMVTRPDGTIDTPFGADLPGVTAEMCAGVGGVWIDFTGYMVHVWNVPGYESPDGMFTELNPALTCPDGTYYQIEIEEVGTRDSTCLNP
jgi:hypothetical protein